jgi:hypothetical protein
MFLIEEVLISDDILAKKFKCSLNQCKGACCWEGDYGAPLEDSELEKINEILDIILPYLPEKNIAKIQKDGVFAMFSKDPFKGTALMEDGSCVFMTKNEMGISACSFEKAYYDGKTTFKKPISCHLYPIRRTVNDTQGFEALNYDEWDICQSACSLGEKEQIPLYQFAKDALIRQYGSEFYEILDQYYKSKSE